MASGINSTLRQVGIAPGVATLGSVLAGKAHSSVLGHLRAGPLAAHAHSLATAIAALATVALIRPRDFVGAETGDATALQVPAAA
jgi:hypothetical protein